MKTKLFFTTAIAALLPLLCTSATQNAPKTFGVPSANPRVKVTVPPGWKTIDAGTFLKIYTDEGSVLIRIKPATDNLKEALIKDLKYAAEQGSHWTSSGEECQFAGMNGYKAEGSGSKDGERWHLVERALTLDNTQQLFISTQMKESAAARLSRDIEAIVASITRS